MLPGMPLFRAAIVDTRKDVRKPQQIFPHTGAFFRRCFRHVSVDDAVGGILKSLRLFHAS